MEEKNPEAFWKLVNNLKGGRESDGNIEPDILYEYFKILYEGINNTHLDLDYKTKIQNRLLNLKNQEWVEILDKSIIIDSEIDTVVK